MHGADSIDGISWASRERALASFDQQMPAKSDRDSSWNKWGASPSRYVDDYLSTKHMADCGGGCPIAALASEVRQEQLVQRAFTDKAKPARV
jgi:hypothetical protein